MKIHIRDMLLLFVIVSIGLAWWKDRSGHHAEIRRIQVDLKAAESSLESRYKALHAASQEADVLAEFDVCGASSNHRLTINGNGLKSKWRVRS